MVIKKKAKEIMGTCFKTFKGTMYKKFILEDKETNWDGGEHQVEGLLAQIQAIQAIRGVHGTKQEE